MANQGLRVHQGSVETCCASKEWLTTCFGPSDLRTTGLLAVQALLSVALATGATIALHTCSALFIWNSQKEKGKHWAGSGAFCFKHTLRSAKFVEGLRMAGPNNLTHLFGLDKTQTKFGHFKTFTFSPSVAITFKQPWDGRPAEFLDKSGCHVVCCDIGSTSIELMSCWYLHFYATL